MRKLTPAALLTGVAVFAAASCSDSGNDITDPNPSQPQAVLAVDDAERALSFNESVSLVVAVVDSEENPVQGVTVAFSGSGVEHTLSAETATTDAQGRASTTLTAGGEAGTIEVQASAGEATPAVFTLTVEGEDPEASALVKVSGDEQTLGLEEESEPLVVEVLDQDDNPMEGVTVAFSGSGAAHSLSEESAVTDEEGRAQITVTAGDEEGEIEVVASVEGLDPVAFTLTVEGEDPEASALVKVSGDEQTLDLQEESEPLVVEVLDQDDNPMEGVTVAFSGSGAGHSLSEASAVTNEEGRAQITVTAGDEEGEIQVLAEVDGLDAVTFTLMVEDAAADFSFLAPEGLPRGLAWDGSSLWVVAGTDSSDPTIYELDPTDGSVRSSFRAPGTGHRDLAWDGEALWYSGHGPRTIFRIDPDGTILNQFDAPGGPEGQPRGLAWDGTYLWHADAAGPERRIFRLSPVDGEVLEVFTSPVTLPVALEWDGSHLWVSQLSEPTNLVRFDVSGNVVQTLPAPGDAATGLAWDADNGYMWVSDYSPENDGPVSEEVLIRRIRIELDP